MLRKTPGLPNKKRRKDGVIIKLRLTLLTKGHPGSQYRDNALSKAVLNSVGKINLIYH
jgi:hypothetical protein